MKVASPIALVASFSLGIAVAISSGAFAHDAKKHEPTTPMASHSAGSMELHRIMAQGHKMPMPMSGKVDKDFAIMMRMHHEQALKMVEVLLKHGKSAKLKAMAREMKVAQTEEIKELAPYAK